MSGRKEQDKQIEQWIELKLINQSQLLNDYMLSIKKKTSMTRRAYLRYLIQYVNYMNSINIPLTEVKPMHIDRYIEHISQGNGPGIVNAKLSAVISFYNFLERNELVLKNPCSSDMKLKIDAKDTVVYMTDPEIEKLKKAATANKTKYANRDLCIITLGCATGLRVSAIVNIDIEDINFEEGTIQVIEKGNKKRTIYIGANTLNSIKTWMHDRQKICGNNTGALFLSQKGNKRIAVRTVQDMIHNASKGIDKHITPHKMRSTCAMKLYDKTHDIYLTAQQLGHANIRNTMIYAQATDERKREAALLLD